MVAKTLLATYILAIGGFALAALASNCIWTPNIVVYLTVSSENIIISLTKENKKDLPTSEKVCKDNKKRNSFKFFVNYECCNEHGKCQLFSKDVNPRSPELTNEAFCKKEHANDFPNEGEKAVYHSMSFECC